MRILSLGYLFSLQMVELFLWVCMVECCSLSLEIESLGAALGFLPILLFLLFPFLAEKWVIHSPCVCFLNSSDWLKCEFLTPNFSPRAQPMGSPEIKSSVLPSPSNNGDSNMHGAGSDRREPLPAQTDGEPRVGVLCTEVRSKTVDKVGHCTSNMKSNAK